MSPRRSSSRLAAVLLGLLLALAGCQGQGQRLDGSWGEAKATATTTLPPLGGVEFNILGGELTGSDGCNPMKAQVAVEDGHLVTSGMSLGAQGCTGDAGTVSTWVQGLLASRPAIEVDGDMMRLTGAGGTLQLRKR